MICRTSRDKYYEAYIKDSTFFPAGKKKKLQKKFLSPYVIDRQEILAALENKETSKAVGEKPWCPLETKE